MMDPKVTQAIAQGKVPVGVSAEFLSESKDRPAIIAIILVTVITSTVVLLRVISRLFVVKRFGVDDSLALSSWSCFIAFVAMAIVLIQLGSGRHFAYVQYVLSNNEMLWTQLLDFVAHIVYTIALLLCRMSGLAFYSRLCRMHEKFKIAIQVAFGIMVAGFLPQILLLIFHCHPVTGYWPYDFQPEFPNFTCLQWGVVYCVNSGVSLLCDLMIFGIPIAMLWTLEMTRKKKIQLGSILLPGILVIAISIARLVLVVVGQWEADMSWAYNPMLGVEVTEIGATLIALSVPGVKPIFDKYVLGKNDTSTSGSTSNRRQNKTSESSGGTRLRTLKRGQHDVLNSQEAINHNNYEAAVSAGQSTYTDDVHSTKSTDGIYVKVDFDIKEVRAYAR